MKPESLHIISPELYKAVCSTNNRNFKIMMLVENCDWDGLLRWQLSDLHNFLNICIRLNDGFVAQYVGHVIEDRCLLEIRHRLGIFY